MVHARLNADSSCEVADPDTGVVRWPTVEAWADAWIGEWLENESGPASAFLDALTDGARPGVVGVLISLANRADGDPEILSWIGAGPLEDLVSHSGHGEDVIDEIERAAYDEPELRRAVGGVWLGAAVSAPVRERLVRLGARDLSAGVRPEDLRRR